MEQAKLYYPVNTHQGQKLDLAHMKFNLKKSDTFLFCSPLIDTSVTLFHAFMDSIKSIQ